MSADIVLVNPPAPGLRQPTAYPPLGLLYLASALRRYGVVPSVANLAGRPVGIPVESVLPAAPVYGISCHTATYPAVRDHLVPEIRRAFPGSRIVLGGPHATALPERTMRECSPDVLVDGEGEVVLPGIVMGPVRGVVKAARLYNLDDLSLPARDMLPFGEVFDDTGIHLSGPEPATTIVSSRGCPYRCAFCSKTRVTDGVRYRSPASVLTEMEQVRRTHGVRAFRFVDDAFSVDRARLLELCEMLEGGGWRLLVILRADTIQDPEVLQAMARAGVEEACIGVESADQAVLKRINKRETVEEMIAACRGLREAGIRSKVFLIQGLPGERPESVEATKTFMYAAQPDAWTLSRFVPLPGSPIWQRPEQYGVDPASLSVDSGWFYPDSEPGPWRDLRTWLEEGAWKA